MRDANTLKLINHTHKFEKGMKMKKLCLLVLFLTFGFSSVILAANDDVKAYMKEMKVLNDMLDSRRISENDYEQKSAELRKKYLHDDPRNRKQQIQEKPSTTPVQQIETVSPNNIQRSQSSSSSSVVQNINNATVQIEVFDKAGSKRGSGSGFIVDPSGIIVTNNHVLNNAASILVKMANGDSYKDIMVRDFDEVKDLALIKISGYDLPTVKLGNSSSLKGGERILVCGFSLGEYANTISDGLISGIRQSDKGYRYLQMSAPISPGNSGGPVVLETGEVIGVSTVTHMQGQNLNFAVPINYVLGMLENDKKLTLAQYSNVCGQSMEHMIIDAKNTDEQLAHPDADISNRIVIVPFSGYCQFMPTIGTEILAALILRMKANYKEEKLYVVDHQTVVKNLQSSMGDQYDTLLATFDESKAHEFAVKFRANTVVFGKVNHFAIDTTPVFVPFVGWVPGSNAVMNIDYSVYKLDQDKVILKGTVRRKQEGLAPNEAVLRIANVIVGDLLKKWKTFASSNKHGSKPIKVSIDNTGKAKVELKSTN